MRLTTFLLFAGLAASAMAGVAPSGCDCRIAARTALEATAGAGASAVLPAFVPLD